MGAGLGWKDGEGAVDITKSEGYVPCHLPRAQALSVSQMTCNSTRTSLLETATAKYPLFLFYIQVKKNEDYKFEL